MPDAVRAQFQSLIDLLSGAQVQRKLQFQHQHIPPNAWGGQIDKFLEDGDAALEALARIVNQRLFRHEP